MITLRSYQSSAITQITNAFKRGVYSLILQAATGAGKTVIFTILADLVAKKGNKVLILTDRAELLLQAGSSLKQIGLKSFYIADGIKVYNSNYNAYIAMSQTFRNRIKLEYWQKFLQSISLVIIDECHKQEFNYLFESGLLKNKHVIGFTATPLRSGKMRQLGLDYELIIETVPVKYLIENNYLVNDDYYNISGVDLAGLEINPLYNDFKTGAMYQRFNSPKLYAGVVKNYIELVPNTKALCFCVNIAHTIKTALEFEKHGISVKYIVSNVNRPQPLSDSATIAEIEAYNEKNETYLLYKDTYNRLSGDRETVFNSHKNGAYRVLINAGIATTGYDDKTIETIILNRATLSLTLFLQMLGRGSRATENKTHFNVLDFGGNKERHGSYSEPRFWSVWHEEKKGGGVAPIKSCGFDSQNKPIHGGGIVKAGCNRPIMASMHICPFCGFKYPEKQVKEIELRLTTNVKSIKNMAYAELYEYWRMKKHNTNWLWRQLYYKGGANEIEKFGKEYGWSLNTINKAKAFCNAF